MNLNSPLIEIKNLKFSYSPTSPTTLYIPEFEVSSGEEVYIYGPSGTGKTTFLEILAGVLTPQEGEVNILGKNLTQMSARERDKFRAEHLGYVFQSFNLIPYLSVFENIELPLKLSKERRAKLDSFDYALAIRGLCGSLGISDLLDKNVSRLSVGQQQRVAVARAMIGKPDIILADEPTSALDSDHREKFLKILFELAEFYGTTVLFVSHDRSIENLFSRAVSLGSINKVVS